MGTGKVKTYASNQVLIALGSHSVSGYADDSFVSIEPAGDGIMKKVGCDGEIARAVSPDKSYKVKITVLQTSETNAFLQSMHDRDRSNGDGLFSVLIKDLKGGVVFSADSAWVTKPASRTYGKGTNNREWEIDTGEATYSE